MSNDRIPSEESLSAECVGNDELSRLEYNILTANPLDGRAREILSEVMYACSTDVPPDYDHEEQDECPDLCWMQKRAYDRFAEIDHEEPDEQTWLDKLRRFQHSLLQLKSKKIIASEMR